MNVGQSARHAIVDPRLTDHFDVNVPFIPLP